MRFLLCFIAEMAKLYVGELRFILIAADAEHHDLFAMTYEMNISFFSLLLAVACSVQSAQYGSGWAIQQRT